MKKITLFLSAMLFSMMSFAGVITFTPGEFDALESSKFDVEKDGVTLSCSSGTITADQFRFFKSQTLTVSSTAGNITSIEFTCTAANETKHGPGGFGELEGYSYADKVGTWAGSAASVTFSTTNNQVRATQVVVTIDGEGGGETPDTPVDPEEPETPVDPENPDPENPEPENPETPSGEVTFDADVDNEGVGTDSNNATAYSLTKNGVTMTVSSGILGTYNNENHYRVYKNQTLTLTSTAGNIVKVEFTCTANDETKYGPGCFTASTGDYTWSGSVGTWTGSASEVVFTAATNQVRATQVVVTLGEGGGETPDPENPENPDPEQPDPENPDPEQPDPENPDPENPDPENPENPETPSGEVTFDADVDNEGVGTDSNNATAYSVTKNGVTMTVSSGILGTYNNENHYRVYKNQTLTITSTTGNIVKVEFTCTANDETKYGPGCFTASTGDYTWSGPVGTWTGSDSEVVFTATTNQVRATQVVVTLGEGGGDNPGGDDPVTPEVSTTITGLKEADAYFIADAEYGDFWMFDLFAGYDYEAYDYVYPELYIQVNEAYGKTTINGTYNVLYTEYLPTADSEGIYTDEAAEDFVGMLTIKNVDNNGNYSFKGSFTATDGKTYTYDQVVKVTAYEYFYDEENDEEIYEDLTLSENGDTPDNPDTPEGMITCAEAATIAAAENYKGTENVTVYGYVVELGNQKVDDKTGRNKQTFYMSDTKGGEQQFMAYWAFVPDFFEVGDKVAITGILQNYKGTIEIADGEAVLLNETGVDDVLVENTPMKVIKNAQMYIMQGNKVYTIMGTQVK